MTAVAPGPRPAPGGPATRPPPGGPGGRTAAPAGPAPPGQPEGQPEGAALPTAADGGARSRRRRRALALTGLGLLTLVAALAALALGSVRLPLGEVVSAIVDPSATDPAAVRVVRTVRLPRTAAATLAGAALAVAGVQMQTIFRNPLADPFVLGVSEGASFGVAVAVVGVGGSATAWLGGIDGLGELGVVGAALVGAGVTALVVLAAATRVEGTATVLIVGIMIGAVVAAAGSMVVAAAEPERLQQWFAWTRGSFRGVTTDELQVMAPLVIVGLVATMAWAKWLDALLLGERYAASVGVPVRLARTAVLLTACLLAASVTAFSGPIAFIGMAAPHLARPAVGTSRHRTLLPAAALTGATVALVAEVVAQMPGQAGVLPLNAVTALVGAPVVVWVLVGRRRPGVIT